MAKSPKTRGRPQGSGIDDAAQLKAIADLLIAEPELKPTSAIRRLGHDNPSTIRRLREKFKACRDQELRDAQSRQKDTVRPAPMPPEPKAAEPEAPRRSAEHAQADRAGKGADAPVSPRPGPGSDGSRVSSIEQTFPWIGFATRCSLLIANEQLRFAQQMAQHPAMAPWLEQNAQVLRLMLSLSGRPRKRE